MVRLIFRMVSIYNPHTYAFGNRMPRKRVTWIGSIIILAAAVFCFWALFQYRARLLTAGAKVQLVTAGAFVALAVAVIAIFLWYYFNEKQ